MMHITATTNLNIYLVGIGTGCRNALNQKQTFLQAKDFHTQGNWEDK
jgi:hypothetical protein